MKKLIHLSLLLLGTFAWGQEANDCTNAVVVCGNSTISSNASGFGTQELDNESNPCFFEEVNSLWLQLNIAQSGELSFTLTPDSPAITVDYDFYVFGPNFSCGSFNDPIRCSTTNPEQAGLADNLTGLRSSESDDSEGPGEDGNSFVSPLMVTAGETYYLLIDRPQGSGGFSLDWEGSSDFYDPPPIIGEPDAIVLCLAGTRTTVDLTQNEAQIGTDPSIGFEYYTSLANAFDGVGRIANPMDHSLTNANTTIYVKVTGGNSCFEVLEQVIDVENYIDAVFGYSACDQDGNGTEEFQISQITADLQNEIQNQINYTVSLHPTEADAENGTAVIGSATFDTGTTTIFARISYDLDASCFITLPVSLDVVASPIPLVAQLIQCDVDTIDSSDGLTSFNLDQAFSNVSGAGTFEYSFYESPQERLADIPITNTVGYVNTQPFNQTIYYKIITDDCESLGTLELQVEPTSVGLYQLAPLVACDDDPNDGVLQGFFDLATYGQQVNPDRDIVFYDTLQDASLEENPLPGNFSTPGTTVYFRVENANQCETVEELELLVFPLPEVNLEPEYFICMENPELRINAPPGFDIYQWYRIEGGSEEVISPTESVLIDRPGNYSLEIGSYVIMGQSTLCTNRVDFVVSPSNQAVITEVIVKDASENNSLQIGVSGDGDYEYSLDGTNYQDNNLFENLTPGIVTIYVRDKKGCGIIEEIVSVLGFPKFFTPNGDDVNDFWQIIGVDPSMAQNTTISIYDRYGKLLKRLDANGQGWDGNYNDIPLPPSDYWFRVIVPGSREFKGHFALKR